MVCPLVGRPSLILSLPSQLPFGAADPPAFACMGAGFAAHPGVSTLPTVPGMHILRPAVTRQRKQGISVTSREEFLQA